MDSTEAINKCRDWSGTQEDPEFKVSLFYATSSKTAWAPKNLPLLKEKKKKQRKESRFPLDSGRLNIELSVLRGQIVLKLGLGHGHKPSSPVWWLAHTFKSQHLVDRDRQISRV